MNSNMNGNNLHEQIKTPITKTMVGGTKGVANEISKQPYKNNPYTPNQKKELDHVKTAASKPSFQPQAPPPIVDLKVYSPQGPSGPRKEKPTYSSPFPYHIPAGGPYYPMGQLLQPLMYPVITNYTISASDPNMDFSKINFVFEDVLPLKELVDTSITIAERINMTNFVRSILMRHGDGEEISLNGKDKNNLLSYLKFMEVNPYHADPHYNNPLKTLPNNMLLYRTAYPIKYSPDHGTVVISEPSIGINVRIYRMSMAEYKVKENKNANYYDYDLWREIAYYEYIREKIIKSKISPNFVMMHSYYINTNKTINFDKINKLRGNTQYNAQYISAITQPLYTVKNTYTTKDSFGRDVIIEELDPNPQADSGKCLIALTEAPTHSLLGWASKIYQKDINIKRMINTGYHSDKVWTSILFQLMVALYILQKERIAINNMHVRDSVFIKDLKIEANSAGWWKYKINGVDFYIPNYGYLLQIDTNYKDVIPDSKTLTPKDCKTWKIQSSIYNVLSDVLGGESISSDDIDKIDKLTYKNFCTLINPNEFNNEFKNMGGVKPGNDVMSLISKINDNATDYKIPISDYIYNFMGQYVHNRVGTYLLQKEMTYINTYGSKDFKKGDMVILNTSNDTYIWVVYIKSMDETDVDLGTITRASIFTKSTPDSKEVVVTTVSFDSLSPYTKGEKIDFIVRPLEPKYADEELLEVYNVNYD
jgi:hypothetical protein